MSDTVIHAENLGKKYRLRHQKERQSYVALRDVLADRTKGLARRVGSALRPGAGGVAGGQPAIEDFWALRNVSFEIKQGETMGIIGRNGAGKSTLLKVLSRITEPTEGRVRGRGRIASLLEVGTGFHPELTGRENIYLNGAILGMAKVEIKSKFDEIVAFAEVEKFLDTPVKRFSSGMYVRLAFAVAAHLEPEILLVDEVLAVGDANFRKKCLGKMSDVARTGRTIFFVSHNMLAIQTLCSRVLWVHEGKIAADGPTAPTIARYLQSTVTAATERIWENPEIAPGSDEVRLHRASVRPANGGPSDAISTQTPVKIEFDYWNLQPDNHLHLSLHVLDNTGTCVFASNTVREPNWYGRPHPIGIFRSVCQIPANLLNDGTYRLKLHVVKNGNIVLFVENDVLVFDVLDDSIEDRAAWMGKWPGFVRPSLKWETEFLGSSTGDGVARTEVQARPDTVEK